MPSLSAYRTITTPKTRMMAPEMRRPSWDFRGPRSTDENAPIAVKTTANPPRKSNMGSRGLASSLVSPPAMNERYEGKSGRTHGDRNDRRPAATATRTFSSAPGISFLSARNTESAHRDHFFSATSWAKYFCAWEVSQSRPPMARQRMLPSRARRKVTGRARTP